MDLRTYLRHLDYFAAGGGRGAAGLRRGHDLLRDPSRRLTSPLYYARYQVAYAAVGVAALVALSLLDYEHYRRWQWPLYAFVLVSIAAVFALGPVTRGSRAGSRCPFVNFQPSELALVILTVTLAAFLADRLQ